jgi:hypothetical protein
MKLMQKKPVEHETDWGRIEQSIKQRFRREPRKKCYVDAYVRILKELKPLLGKQSHGRRALRNIGTALLTSELRPIVISPICLSIPPGPLDEAKPSTLADKHVAFMESLSGHIRNWQLFLLFPPPERDDEHAHAYIERVRKLTEEKYRGDMRVTVAQMTALFEGAISSEEDVIGEINRTPYLSRMCARLTHERSEYYRKINIPSELWARRTRRTMAQYIILGRIASMHSYLICNHTSANIACEVYAGGAVLHNPVGFM